MIDGKRVRELRQERRMTLRELAEKVSVLHGKTISFQAVALIEDGQYEPSVSRTAALAAALEVGMNDILLPFEPALK